MKRTAEEEKEVGQIASALVEFKEPKYAADSLGMSMESFSEKLEYHGIPKELGYDVDMASIRETSSTFEQVTQLINSATPDAQGDKFLYARKYAENDDLINSITRTKANFGMAGFHVQSPDKQVQDFCAKVNREVDMDALVHQIWDKTPVEGNAPFYYDIQGGDVNDIQIMDPNLLEVYPLYTSKKGRRQKASILHIPNDFKKLYQSRNSSANKDVKAIQEAFKKLPTEMKKALDRKGVGKGKDGIEIYEGDGKYLRIINHKGQDDRLVDPEMKAIFKLIRLRHLMLEGDYAINYHMKAMIHQVKIAQQITDNVPKFIADALAKTGLSTTKAKKIAAAYKTVEHVLREVTDGTVTHEFHAPDPKYLKGEKYLPVETQILRWGGIALVLLSGENANYSGGYIYIKALIADIMKWRRRIARTLEQFYYDLAPGVGRSSLKNKMINSDSRPAIMFSDNIMKEPKQLLDEIRFMVTQGGLDWQTAHEGLGISHRVTKERMEAMWKDEGYKFFYPLFEMHQGILVPYTREPQEPREDDDDQPQDRQPGKPGRPEKDGKQTKKDGSPRQPRPSEA